MSQWVSAQPSPRAEDPVHRLNVGGFAAGGATSIRYSRACKQRNSCGNNRVVANIQMRTLKTEVENGSLHTAIGQGLAAPKR